jgi:hypothetical protein
MFFGFHVWSKVGGGIAAAAPLFDQTWNRIKVEGFEGRRRTQPGFDALLLLRRDS